MISANIPSSTRKAIYRRDGFRCALCGFHDTLQIHHYCPRGQGGSDHPHNLITLCSWCHGKVHGTFASDDYMKSDEVEQAICEYLSDMYAGEWYPFK